MDNEDDNDVFVSSSLETQDGIVYKSFVVEPSCFGIKNNLTQEHTNFPKM